MISRQFEHRLNSATMMLICLLPSLCGAGCKQTPAMGNAVSGTPPAGVSDLGRSSPSFDAGAPPLSLPPDSPYPWPHITSAETIAGRFSTPPGYVRPPLPDDSFGRWLRGLPLKPGRPLVRLFNGQAKANQRAHAAVIDIDVGDRNLQQCADAVIRLRAEYLFGTKQRDAIHFNFTSGDQASWVRWREGYRPRVAGNRVTWARTGAKGSTYAGFRTYLDTVFMYAGTYSLKKELTRVRNGQQLEAGDVFIQGGFPGHAVLVADVATRVEGPGSVFMLVQSYMPAQEIHVLKNPGNPGLSPWYSIDFGEKLETPEWTFTREALHRFVPPGGS